MFVVAKEIDSLPPAATEKRVVLNNFFLILLGQIIFCTRDTYNVKKSEHRKVKAMRLKQLSHNQFMHINEHRTKSLEARKDRN